jgi:LysM repeat protein
VHVVHRGDTMWSIARRTGMDVNKLAMMNGMQPGDPLRAGQRIRLSNSDPGGRGAAAPRRVTYTVRAGDTLTQIAKLFQCSVKEIMAWNGIGSRSGIAPGQKLTIRMATRRG